MLLCLRLRIIIVFFFSLLSSCYANGIVLGFLWGFGGRTGFILGYNVKDQLFIEGHFGGLPERYFTFGLNARYKFQKSHRVSLIIGYSLIEEGALFHHSKADSQITKYKGLIWH